MTLKSTFHIVKNLNLPLDILTHLWALLLRPSKGFYVVGEIGAKTGREQDAKMSRQLGAEESNLGSIEHRICHNIFLLCIMDDMCLTLLGI